MGNPIFEFHAGRYISGRVAVWRNAQVTVEVWQTGYDAFGRKYIVSDAEAVRATDDRLRRLGVAQFASDADIRYEAELDVHTVPWDGELENLGGE
jgi:hypothetical protein